MSRNRRLILIVRILLFVALGVFMSYTGMGMEIPVPKMVFIGIGLSNFAYAIFLAYFFWKR